MIVATMPCRNEDWIIGLSLRALLMWVDAVVVLDHCSTDSTRAIIDEIGNEDKSRILWVRHEDSPVWEEMRHRQLLLDQARKLGGTHMVIVDADEVLTGDLLPHIRGMVENCPPNATMELPWQCLRDSCTQVHRSGVWGEQNASMGFVDSPELHWSSAGRGSYDFHHRAPMGRGYSPYRPLGNRLAGLMHLQFVSARRLIAKQALYQATEVLRWPGRETPEQIRKKYSLSVYGNPGESFDLVTCPPRWWAPYAHLVQYYKPEAEPWQEVELKRLIAEHGMDKFKGLDFFGVV